MLSISDFATLTLTYPEVLEGPETEKLNSLLVELKTKAETEELDDIEKTYFSWAGLTAMFMVMFEQG